MNTTYLAADTVNGVYKIDPIDFPELELIRPKDFYNALPTVSDDEIIFAAFEGDSEDIFKKIEQEYGIH